MAKLFIEVKDENGKLVGSLSLPSKAFKTGSVGFYANGKLELDGKRYQGQFQLVEIGSKKANAEGDAK